MANFNFYIKDEGLARILFIENASSQDEITKVGDAITNLQWACEEYLMYLYGGGGPFESSEEYEAYIEEIAMGENNEDSVANLLGCSLRHTNHFIWYVDDESITGYELPIVWNTSTDDTIRAAEVQGNVISLAKVPLWDWDALNGSYTKNIKTTQKAKSAIDGAIKDKATDERYGCGDFSFNVWNDLCEKAKAAIDAVYVSTNDPTFVWDDTYATYGDTLMSEDSRYLSAARFNSLRYNIGKHESTGIEDVEDGNEVMMSYFTKIVASLNALILKYGLNKE